MKKIGNLYELINDALNEGFSLIVEKDLSVVKTEDKLDELIDEYGEAITEDDELWTVMERRIYGTLVFRHLEPDSENKIRKRYMLIKWARRGKDRKSRIDLEELQAEKAQQMLSIFAKQILSA